MITLITEPNDYSKKAIALYRSLGPVYFLPDVGGKKKNEIFKKTNILVVRLAHTINASWMDKMPDLKVIATNTTGLNHIDTIEAKKRGIGVISLRGHTKFLKDIPSTAEHTIALILALVRNIPWAYKHVALTRGWNRDVFKGNQLLGKTLGIIGYGRLGKIVARYAKAFGMDVIVHDPYVRSFGKIKNVLLDALCRESDIISLHASYDPENPQVILGKEQFELMKPTAYFINTARGELVNEEALLDALVNNKIRGAALDVLANESGDSPPNSILRDRAQDSLNNFEEKGLRLLIVPHLGGATYEAMQITEEFIADLVRKYFK